MKDLIIGCSTNYDWSKLKYWINSINQSGFEGEKVLILMNCDRETVIKVHDAGFKIIGFDQDENKNLYYSSPIPVHVDRFIHIYNFIRGYGPFRYVITTDVKDVIFQKNPIEYIEKNIGDKNLIFSSESMFYKDEPWGNQNLLETFGQAIYNHYVTNEIFNVGVLAGKGEAMKHLAMSIFDSATRRPISICDQSTFNFMISMHPYLDTSLYTRSEDGWACQLGTTKDPSKIERFKSYLLEPEPLMENEIITTSKQIPYHIVHQYDRVPEWRKIIEAKYG